MAENLIINGGNKRELYETLLPQLQSLTAGETDIIANMANVAAALKQKVRFRDHILDLLHGQKGTELFQIFRIHLVKLAQLVAVDIQYGNHFSISDHRYDNFRPRGGATGDMPRKLLHIRDDDCPCFFPGCPAYAFPVPDTRTGKRTLERGEHEYLFFHDL